MTKAIGKTVRVTLRRDGPMCFIPVAFDSKALFGKVRAPVKVTLRGYSFGSTIFRMGGITCIPLRRSHREAAGIEGMETLNVTIALDTAVRKVALPPDLARAFRTHRAAARKWDSLSYSHRREYVEAIVGAKKPETRVRRLTNTLHALEGINSTAKVERR